MHGIIEALLADIPWTGIEVVVCKGVCWGFLFIQDSLNYFEGSNKAFIDLKSNSQLSKQLKVVNIYFSFNISSEYTIHNSRKMKKV